MADFKHGDVREDGWRFKDHYDGKDRWVSPAAFHRFRVGAACVSARKRASAKGLPFDLNTDYLQQIFPEDGLCPALGIPLIWGDADGRHNSPALDRKEPALGYVQGNVQWLSQRANCIKSDATTAQVCAVADFLRKNDYR